ncbi:hypothetical protein EV2_020095 [Malus domestica]
MQNKSWWDVRNCFRCYLQFHAMPEYKSRNGDSRQEAPQVCASVHTGIGKARAGLIISELNMTNKLAEDLTRREVAAIGEEISKYLVGRELV